MINKIKKVVRIVLWKIFLLGVIFFSAYFAFYALTHKMRREYTDCGIIEKMISDDLPVKHGSHTYLYMRIYFEKAGYKVMDVSIDTYTAHKVGDSICFTLTEDEENKYHMLIIPLGYITLFIYFIIFVIWLNKPSEISWNDFLY